MIDWGYGYENDVAKEKNKPQWQKESEAWRDYVNRLAEEKEEARFRQQMENKWE